MSITVGQGTAGIPTGVYPNIYHYWIANTTTTGTPAGESVAISTADGSNPRITTIVGYVDQAASFNDSPANFPGGFTLAAVDGTPAGSPTAPSGATIQAAVGGSNPYIILADVLVGTGVTQINSGNITDRRTWATTSARNLSNPYKFRARPASDQTGITGSTWTTVTLGTEDYDTGSNFASSTFTASTPGFYHFNVEVSTVTTAGTMQGMGLRLYKNGTTTVVGGVADYDNNTSYDILTRTLSDTIQLSAGDTVVVQAFISVSSGTAGVSANATKFSGHIVSIT
jgi:hypothetical protein